MVEDVLVVLTGVAVVLMGVAVCTPICVPTGALACALKICKAGTPTARTASKTVTQITGIYLFKHIPLSY